VIDSESTDNTRDIAAESGARVLVNAWPGFSKQKQFAVDQATHDWIFSLDADERVSPNCAPRLTNCVQGDRDLADGYVVAPGFYESVDSRWRLVSRLSTATLQSHARTGEIV
jgi:glycosyltransferase involved in cell wall biosynthesis